MLTKSFYHALFIECMLNKDPALFSYSRIDIQTIPDGLYMYHIRHGDDLNTPYSIENYVILNFYGTIISPHRLNKIKDTNDIELFKSIVTLDESLSLSKFNYINNTFIKLENSYYDIS